MIGGRDGLLVENALVSIWDPASETWRAGPSLSTPRAGFGVVATPTAILLTGGEKIPTPQRVISQTESIAAGEDAWSLLAPLPFPVHGVGATLHGNAFYVIGGSRQAAVATAATNQGRVQIYRWQ
jgi:N-acetylneuraminic acid mutarotase